MTLQQIDQTSSANSYRARRPSSAPRSTSCGTSPTTSVLDDPRIAAIEAWMNDE
jgi:hypothetical protein